jgi:hypothetical protein
MVVIAWIVTFLSERFQRVEREEAVLQGTSEVDTIPAEFVPQPQEIPADEALETEEVTGDELIAEEAMEDVEVEETVETEEPRPAQEEIRAEADEAVPAEIRRRT